LYLAFFGAFSIWQWLFLRVDLAFFAYDYLATLILGLGSHGSGCTAV